MKTTFSYDYMIANGGCYTYNGPEKIENLFFIGHKNDITIDDILSSDIPIKDKYWFVCRKCSLTAEQNRHIAISVAEIVLPIFENIRPGDDRPRKAIEAAKMFIAGHISIDQLLERRRAASDAAADAAAHAASASAACAAYDAAAYAAYDAAAYAAYADAAAYAAYAASDVEIKLQLSKFLIDFVNDNK